MKKETVDVRKRLSIALAVLDEAVDKFAEAIVDADDENWSEKARSLVVDLYLIVFNAEWEVLKKLKAFERRRQQKCATTRKGVGGSGKSRNSGKQKATLSSGLLAVKAQRI
jgi:hypothetical protein